jgi:hypothetical protein
VSLAASANDNAEVRSQSAVSRRRAVIYKPARSATTSGRAGTKRWLLEFEPQSPRFIEPLMGWTGGTDPLASVRLSFPSREAAVAYAERQGWDYEVGDAGTSRRAISGSAQTWDRTTPLWRVELRNADLNGTSDVAVHLAA